VTTPNAILKHGSNAQEMPLKYRIYVRPDSLYTYNLFPFSIPLKVYQQITASIAQSFTRIQQISRGHLNIPDDCNFPIGEIPKAIVIENMDKDVTEDSKFTDYWREEEDINEETEKSRGVARHFGLDFLKMIMPIIFLHIQYI
jgi:hypothetical protein